MIEYSAIQMLTMILFESLETSAGLILACILFRVNFLIYLKEEIIVAIIAGILKILIVYILHLSFALNELITLIVMITILRRWMNFDRQYMGISILIGYMIKQFFAVGLLALGVWMHLIPSLEAGVTQLHYLITLQFLTFILIVPAASYLYFRGIGFMFIKEAIKMDKGINGFILLTLFMSFVATEVIFHYYHVRHHIAFPFIGIALYLYVLGLWGVYYRCKKELAAQAQQVSINKNSDLEPLFKRWQWHS